MTTRRDIIKACAGLAAILAAGKAPAAIIRSMLGARNAIIGGGGKSLPYDSQVEYLESTGTQWIDTGIAFASDVGFRLDCAYTAYSMDFAPIGYQCLAGETATSEDLYSEVYEMDGQVWVDCSGFGSSFVSVGKYLAVNERFLSRINYLADGKAYLSAASILPAEQPIRPSFQPLGYNIGLFCSIDENGDPFGRAKAKCWSFRVSKGSELVREMVPVRKGGGGYMYDRVSGQLFGDGSFGYGPDIAE